MNWANGPSPLVRAALTYATLLKARDPALLGRDHRAVLALAREVEHLRSLISDVVEADRQNVDVDTRLPCELMDLLVACLR